jgi:outer membrane lipoprotein-sorting protein
MRRLICLSFCALLFLSARAFAQVPPWLDADKATVDDVLDTLQNSGKDVKSFSADVQMKIEDEVMSTSSTQIGKVYFQTKQAGDAVLHVALDHKKVAGKDYPAKEDYLLDDGWLTKRTVSSKKETRIQLAKPGDKVNLFQLGKGPFPLPIGQDKKDVHDQFDVKILPADKKNDPPNTIHLQLTPKPGTQMDQNFSTIEVWVDGKTRMPVRMATDNKKHTEFKTTDLLNLQLNPVIKPEEITLPALPPEWTTMDKPIEP